MITHAKTIGHHRLTYQGKSLDVCTLTELIEALEYVQKELERVRIERNNYLDLYLHAINPSPSYHKTLLDEL